MPSLLSLLVPSIHSRLDELRDQLEELKGSFPAAHSSLHAAIDMVWDFPRAASVELAAWLDQAPDEEAAISYARSVAEHVGTVFQVVHDVLVSASRFVSYGTLLRLISAECEDLELGPRTTLICAARPGRIHTETAGFYERIYGDFEHIDEDHREQVEPLHPFLLFNLPRYEAVHARWIPWVLGHELAHVKVDNDSLDKQVNSIPADLHQAWSALEPPAWLATRNMPRSVVTAWDQWVKEILCDAYAVHRFGPAALLSITEFHEAIGGYNRVTRTHPPGHVRAKMMASWIEERNVEALADAVASYTNEPAPVVDELASGFASLLEEKSVSIFELASTMAPAMPLGSSDRVAEFLLQGVPGTPVGLSTEFGSPLSVAEIANGAWIAHRQQGEGARVPPIDRLADHAVTIVDLIDRWTAAGGRLGMPESEDSPPDNQEIGGTVGQSGLIRRMHRQENPLLVVPLLEQAIGSASLDVRLGNRFIVLQRSSSSGFAPLEREDDPRLMQVRISRDWGETLILHPGELVLGATLEYFVVPEDVSAQVITRSSYGRLGIISATAVQVQPGFRGALTLELVDLGEVPVAVQPGERIAQLVFSTVSDPMRSHSKYDCPIGPEFSRVREDTDAHVLRALRMSEE